MKRIFTSIAFFVFLFLSLFSTAQITPTSQWTWVKGDNTVNHAGDYGTVGIPAATNKPGSRQAGVTWTDASGNFWLFGGYGYDAIGGVGYLNDLWKYTPGSNQWTWVKGDFAINQAGVYGTLGVSAPGNKPGSRYLSIGWTDASGNMWLFGGSGYDASGFLGFLNDLWKYDPVTNNWTWIKGDNSQNQVGIYGTLGVAAPANKPGGREASVSWKDGSGNFWLFGGNGYDASAAGYLNDLWKYNPGTNQWTWVKGDNTINQPGVYGTQGTGAAANKPGARYFHTSWKDAAGNFWIFGGNGYDAASTFGSLNDLWKYDPGTNFWTWAKGDNIVNMPGVYGVQGVAAPANKPGARYLTITWADASGNLWLFGGNGYDASTTGFLNDLWKYSPSSTQWTWIKGSNTINQTGIYGTQGTPAATNRPGARQASHSWIDGTGNFWLFGGFGYDASVTGYLNDLFKLSPSGVLPVTIFNVKGYQKNAGVQVEWATQQENNTEKYELEVSHNGLQFTSLGGVQARGNTNIVTNYNLFDPNPNSGANFYRIKIIDKSGKETYSQVIRINISGSNKNYITIYPNPVIGSTIALQLNLKKGNYIISLTNKLGEQIITKTIDHAGGAATENIELSKALAAGVYQLMITGEGTKIVNQVIKN